MIKIILPTLFIFLFTSPQAQKTKPPIYIPIRMVGENNITIKGSAGIIKKYVATEVTGHWFIKDNEAFAELTFRVMDNIGEKAKMNLTWSDNKKEQTIQYMRGTISDTSKYFDILEGSTYATMLENNENDEVMLDIMKMDNQEIILNLEGHLTRSEVTYNGHKYPVQVSGTIHIQKEGTIFLRKTLPFKNCDPILYERKEGQQRDLSDCELKFWQYVRQASLSALEPLVKFYKTIGWSMEENRSSGNTPPRTAVRNLTGLPDYGYSKTIFNSSITNSQFSSADQISQYLDSVSNAMKAEGKEPNMVEIMKERRKNEDEFMKQNELSIEISINPTIYNQSSFNGQLLPINLPDAAFAYLAGKEHGESPHSDRELKLEEGSIVLGLGKWNKTTFSKYDSTTKINFHPIYPAVNTSLSVNAIRITITSGTNRAREALNHLNLKKLNEIIE